MLRYRGMKNRGAREAREGRRQSHIRPRDCYLPFPEHGCWEQREIRKEMDCLRREQEE